jgi:DNA recombination protein RmuC
LDNPINQYIPILKKKRSKHFTNAAKNGTIYGTHIIGRFTYMDIALLAASAVLLIAAVAVFFLGRGRQSSETGQRLAALDSAMRDEFTRSRGESARAARESREELVIFLKNQFETFSGQQESMRRAVDFQLREIREETAKKLEEMRRTVDENLKETVEKRFNESFKLISERLEQVHKGLGEMQQLASGVGDLKRVHTNVKTKGNLGEIQLGGILEQILSPGQYEAQKSVRPGSLERVDYVIKLPDKNSLDKTLLLPVDSKFPTEDYQRLLDAYDSAAGDDETRRARMAFELAVKKCAKDIREKYINPPATTDFAIMFVPSEGLYAEIVRRVELFEALQRDYKVTVVGPTNLAAFLSSLQMGFRTLAIERRSNEVWELLGAVKTEFGKFGGVIENIKRKIDAAAKEIDTVGTRSRAIERKLRNVEELPAEDNAGLLEQEFDLSIKD